MLGYFKNHHSRRITGSSILMIADHSVKKYAIKIIDLSSCSDFDELDKRDEGYVFGIENLIRIMNEF